MRVIPIQADDAFFSTVRCDSIQVFQYIRANEHKTTEFDAAPVHLSLQTAGRLKEAAYNQYICIGRSACGPTLVQVVDEQPHLVLLLGYVACDGIIERSDVTSVNQLRQIGPCRNVASVCKPLSEAVDLPKQTL